MTLNIHRTSSFLGGIVAYAMINFHLKYYGMAQIMKANYENFGKATALKTLDSEISGKWLKKRALEVAI